jgi:hypothetical protein
MFLINTFGALNNHLNQVSSASLTESMYVVGLDLLYYGVYVAGYADVYCFGDLGHAVYL